MAPLALSTSAFSQQTVDGRVLSPTGEGVQGATVRLVSAGDSTIQHGAVSKRDGSFKVINVPNGAWRLNVSMLGLAPYTMTTFVRGSDVSVGDLRLVADTVALQGVEVESDVIASELKGDTAQFNAKAYKTNVNATAEELVQKMPGVTIENGTVKAQGEDVSRVLVDGKRFFGDDARQTLKNVPADMVENVQVYDARTNLSMYSGFDDGNTEKTINLRTKKDKKKGSFGNVLGGYGSDNRYNGSASINMFDGPQRITVLGLTNNINQQNFSIQDILGSMGVSGGQAKMMTGMVSRMGASSMLSRMGSGAANLFVGQSNGISTTHAIGTQYSDDWAPNVQVSGSYFFNYSDNNNNSSTDREYVQPEGQTYAEDNQANTISRNHRFNFRLESDLDSANKLLVEPRFSYQSRLANTGLFGLTSLTGTQLSSTNTATVNTPEGMQVGADVDYSHRFNAEGRTLAFELGSEYRNSTADGSLMSTNTFQSLDTSTSLDQKSTSLQKGTTLNGSVSWVEPLGDLGTIRFQYEPSVTYNDADKKTYGYDSVTNAHSELLPLLTNTYANTYTTQLAKFTHRYQFGNTILTAGLGYQISSLDGDVTFPTADIIKRDFYNIIPEFQLRQRFSQQSELIVRYRLNTQAPSISQLQNVIDNSNPLQLSIGNPDLDQALNHNIVVRFRDVNWLAGKTLFGYISANIYKNYVGTRTIVTSTDTTVSGISLPPGATITAPVNLDGYMRLNSFFTYGTQLGFIKSNLNINGGVNYQRTPSTLNGATNYSNNTGVRTGFYVSSNISEDLDLSIGYDANYNVIINSLTRTQDANYFNHTATGRLIWNIGMVACSTDVAHSLYSGLGAGYDQVYTVWNAGIGWRMLDNAGELRLSVFDILHQNASVYRTVNPVSIDNTQTQVITRYAMLSFSYSLKAFDQQQMQAPSRPPFR